MAMYLSKKSLIGRILAKFSGKNILGTLLTFKLFFHTTLKFFRQDSSFEHLYEYILNLLLTKKVAKFVESQKNSFQRLNHPFSHQGRN